MGRSLDGWLKGQTSQSKYNPAERFDFVYYNKLECGPMPNVMDAQPNIGGALCESSVKFHSLY